MCSSGSSQSTSIPDARGGHSSAVTSAPHRRPLEGSEESSESDTTRHHSHDLHETWKTQEEGRVYTMPYDKLVIACGTYQRTFGTPGVVQNAWFLKDVQNARAVRWRVLECFEQAEHPELNDDQRRKLLNFIIVGGGPTGAEMAAALYDLVNSDLKRTFPEIHHLAKITIVDAAGAILNTFDESLQKYARDNFLHDGIDLKLNRKPVRECAVLSNLPLDDHCRGAFFPRSPNLTPVNTPLTIANRRRPRELRRGTRR